MTHLTLGYVGFESAKRTAWDQFAEVLALGLSDESDAKTLFLRMDDLHHRIAVHAGPAEGLQYLGWDAGSEDTLHALVERLKKGGVAVQSGSAELCAQRAVQALYEFQDANGVRSELFIGPSVRSGPLRTAAPTEGGFVTGDEGLGHVVFGCPDMKASNGFYQRLLGFRLTDSVRSEVDLDFLRCNPRHHSIGFMQTKQPLRFQHLMIQVAELNDLGRCVDRAEALGFPVARSLGRHDNEHMLSVYLQAPSGFYVEVGWGGISVRDEASWATRVYSRGSLWGHKWLVKHSL